MFFMCRLINCARDSNFFVTLRVVSIKKVLIVIIVTILMVIMVIVIVVIVIIIAPGSRRLVFQFSVAFCGSFTQLDLVKRKPF